jgi:two-component system OmpR family response regulator
MTYLPHILVVDDDQDICEVVRQLLESNGYRVSIAYDGVAMRRIIAEEKVDLAIIDAALPGESGSSLAHHAKDLDVPAVMMTGDLDEQPRVALSGHPFIFKPFRIADLLGLVAETLLRAQG